MRFAIRRLEGGSTCRVERQVTTGPRALLVVTDQGPGIAPAERERVFDRFYRVPGTAAGGSGIGLALVRSIARHHGGDVRLDGAASSTGLRVSVDLPALAQP